MRKHFQICTHTIGMKKSYLLLIIRFAVFPYSTFSFIINSTTMTNIGLTSTKDQIGTKSSSETSRKKVPCIYVRGYVMGDGNRALQCCDTTVKEFHDLWMIPSFSLSRYLETLKRLNCPQFKRECNQRLFDFNAFTGLMYDYICNNKTYLDKCLPKLMDMSTNSTKDRPIIDMDNDTQFTQINKNSSIAKHDMLWQKILVEIHPAQMTVEELIEPCVQIVQYAQTERNKTAFQEFKLLEIPTCDISWCGISSEAFKTHEISIGTCLDTSCRRRVIAIMIAFGILGFAIIVVNILIIVVLLCFKTKSPMPLLNNSQSIFKISLAVADLIVGLIVLPTCIVNLYTLVWKRLLLSNELQNVKGFDVINETLSENVSEIQLNSITISFYHFPLSYANFAGFFTALSLFTSVFVLVGSGFDRLKAVARPFSYQKEEAITAAKKTCFALWTIPLILGILPVFIHDLRYSLFVSTIFLTSGIIGFAIIAAGTFIPFILVWIVNILTYYYYKKQANNQLFPTQAMFKKRQEIEHRLASTLRYMVGIFTFNTFPVVISCIIHLVMPTDAKSFNPKSYKIVAVVQFTAMYLFFFNSLCNFFIYSIRNHDFRQALKSLFGKLW